MSAATADSTVTDQYIVAGDQALDTPLIAVDIDLLRRNIAEMAALAAGYGVALRPHAKTHKSPHIARLQLEAGAVGLTCAKLGEAEVLVDQGGRHRYSDRLPHRRRYQDPAPARSAGTRSHHRCRRHAPGSYGLISGDFRQ